MLLLNLLIVEDGISVISSSYFMSMPMCCIVLYITAAPICIGLSAYTDTFSTS